MMRNFAKSDHQQTTLLSTPEERPVSVVKNNRIMFQKLLDT